MCLGNERTEIYGTIGGINSVTRTLEHYDNKNLRTKCRLYGNWATGAPNFALLISPRNPYGSTILSVIAEVVAGYQPEVPDHVAPSAWSAADR